ncbi:tetratricopeptide repeat protein [Thermoleptolyngbya sp.]
MPPDAPAPLTLFVSYSHRDEALKDELIVHLANLKRQGKIAAWQDRDIEAGTEWDVEIKQQLEAAEVILLLITPRFLASDYCYDLEMQRAVQRHDEGNARVIPIILKPCDWQGSPFSKLQVLPKDAKPVTQWTDQDEAFLNVVQGIRRAVESLHAKKQPGAMPDSANAAAVAPSSAPQSLTSNFSTYNPATFTGREAETVKLTEILAGSCRILAIVGMTGIGKTALAERVVASLMDSPHPQSLSQSGSGPLNPAPFLPGEKGRGGEGVSLPYIRFSLDDRSLMPDFSSSGAALLRTLGEEPTLADQQDPANLLAHLLSRLQSHPCRLQIDSLERLLRGNEQEGWSEFCDPLWLDFLHQFLAAADTRSQLLLTSQDIPADLDTVASRYPQFWHCEPLQGLAAAEQLELFAKLGLPQDAETQETLRQIGQFYDGHPLVLQVMAEEMRQPPFSGNVARYGQHYAAEFAALSTAAPAATGNKLDRSRLFRRRVRQRVEQSIQRLPDPARQMLCASAVFRRPVPAEFWYAMLPEEDPYAAFDTLQDRHLVEYAPSDGDTLLVWQHNLIRAVAYSLLKADSATWETAECKAADLWLTAYEPAPNAERLETVRGYLEAFDHYCEVSDWEQASEIYTHQLPSTNQALHWQLLIWSCYKELTEVSRKLVDKISSQTKRLCLSQIGNSYSSLGKLEKAMEYYQQALHFTRETGDRQGEGNALGSLGIVHHILGQYEQAIDFHQQYLSIAREIDDRQGEGRALGNLGIAYYILGQYEWAIDLYRQCLSIVQEIGDRQGEGIALVNMGET